MIKQPRPANALGAIAAGIASNECLRRLTWLTDTALLWPAATLASLAVGVPLAEDAGAPMIVADIHAVRVIPECGGRDFFAMALGLALWNGSSLRPSALCRGLLLAWLATIVANGARLACAVHAQVHSDFLPCSPEAAHLSVGVATFLPALLLFHLATQHLYESKHRHTS